MPQPPPTRPDLDVVLTTALQTAAETSRYDFKEKLDLRVDEHKHKLVRAVGGFTNTDEGGFLIIGVADDRTIVGLADELADQFDQTNVQRLLGNYLAPPPRVLVRQHTRDQKRLVIVEIEPFEDIPSIVSKSDGSGRLQAGTFLTRSNSAESKLVTSDAEVRALCEAIVRRRAQSIVGLFQRGMVGFNLVAGVPPPTPTPNDGLQRLREKADEYWSASLPHLELFFSPVRDLHVGVSELRSLIPTAAIPIEHGYPFWNVGGAQVTATHPWGWVGLIPFADPPQTSTPPRFEWLFRRDGTFINRDPFWEDSNGSVIPGGIGVYHVAGQLILLVRFLDRVARLFNWADSESVTIGIRARHIAQRYLADETRSYTAAYAPRISESEIDISTVVSIADMRAARAELAVNLLEEFTWHAQATHFTRQTLTYVVESGARSHLGPQYAFPAQET